jgi:pimeloyl-ACP methyl ester carboxylesterase
MRQVALALALLLGAPAALAGQADSVRLHAVLANGYRFAYTDRGTGPPILLVHGALTDYRFWDPVATALADSFRVITLSRRYHYPNPWRPDDPPSGFETTAADLAAVIRALQLEQPVVAGHSWASLAVLQLALREPGRLGAIVLVNPVADSFIPDPGERQAVAAARVAGYRDALERFDSRAPTPALMRLLPAWFGPGARLETLEPGARERLLANAHTIPSAAATEPHIPPEALQRLGVPLLLLGGDAAPAEEGYTLQGLEAALPAARRELVPGGGRILPRSHPAAVVSAVRAFLRSTRP